LGNAAIAAPRIGSCAALRISPLWPLAHPLPILRRAGRHEDAADDDAVLDHVEVVLVPADRCVFEDQAGHRRAATMQSGCQSAG
jgi:hypothetical protein